MRYFLIGCMLLFFSACTEDKNIKVYYTAIVAGWNVTCESKTRRNCGMELYDCDSGEIYYCVNNVREFKKNRIEINE